MQLKEQIIKALECCTSIGGCKRCPNAINGKPKDNGDCGQELLENALALIKELTEENERLEHSKAELSKEVADLQDELKCEKETNEHLCGEYMVVKADTVRKMQEQWNELKFMVEGEYYIFAEDLDQIAKERLEGL